MNLLDTIAAISTPFGKGGIAVIRISGGDAIAVADRIFKPIGNVSLGSAEPKRTYYGGIFSGKTLHHKPTAIFETIFYSF